MNNSVRLYAVLAEFDTPEKMMEAAQRLLADGVGPIEAYSPFPVKGKAEALGRTDNKVPMATALGAIGGGVAGFALQIATNWDYPLWVGGRSLIAVPAFMIITLTLMIVGAAFAGGCIMLLANHLPKLNHPMFEAEEFRRATHDRFFLGVIAGEDFDRDKIGKALALTEPRAIIDIPEVRT